jgi:threonylcarbamoyladenosine tRNA methylthiotransferase MtaB
LASSFARQGFTVVTTEEDADLFLINTCTVTARADHKARALVRGLARRLPGVPLIVTGCSAQLEADALALLGDQVIVVAQTDKARLLDLPRLLAEEGGVSAIRAALSDQGERGEYRERDPFALHVHDYRFHTRAWLKVQDGCDSWCAYCRVPLARGASVSLDPREVIRRAQELEALGHREIVITGVNISSYSSAGVALPGLVRSLLGATSAARLRLSSLEPESITEELVESLAHPRICPHFHLPVQSGSDAVLARMRRRYRAERVRIGVDLLRRAGQDPFIAADFISGFPGETDAEFAESLEMAERSRFAALHVFPFSPRGGTAAAQMRPRVPERIRTDRARALGNLSRKLSRDYARSWVGRVVEVLLEHGRPGAPLGAAGNYLKVTVVGIPGVEPVRGRIVRALLLTAPPVGQARFISFV